MQRLWKDNIGWDDDISKEIAKMWLHFRDDLFLLNKLTIPRNILAKNTVCSIQLHGFSDASTAAYGAAVYIRCKTENDEIFSNLLCAKSRVAPIKTITLPKLELCGALLLAQLVNRVNEAINNKFDQYFYYTDSMIALNWIRGCPSKWKVFVANRVTEIQELTDTNSWYHCVSKENPADLISRGCDVITLINSKLWFNGPEWLSKNELQWPSNEFDLLSEVPEERTVVNINITVETLQIFERFSKLNRLQRVIAYILRFKTNCSNKRQNLAKVVGALTPLELNNALNVLVKLSQRESFSKEYSCLVKNKPINATSCILSLCPYIDDHEIIRVGGRLQNSDLEYDKKHPILLSHKHKLTKLILQHEHTRLLHCGVQQLLSAVRERFWPTCGRNTCKAIVRNCLKCYRARPKPESYLMGNLPGVRIKQSYPFLNIGLDFSGPHIIKDRSTRGAKAIKIYICIFICLVTKAMHLELVTNLTTDAFLASFRRFVARRGRPLHCYSDNGTNLVGANNKLQDISKFLRSESDNIANCLASENVTWHFIPPRSPNFGGIWEAGVKSFKTHLNRVLGTSLLTYDSFCTVLTQIEGILNSRPLCPLSTDPTDLNPLTPAHLLIGRSLTALPDLNYSSVPENRLSMFEKIQKIVQHYWARWHREYISELQCRVKWKQNSHQLVKPGAMVLVKEDNTPPLQWKLGRIMEIHPGQDEVVRVATVRVNSGVVKRCISKLCVLPCDETNN